MKRLVNLLKLLKMSLLWTIIASFHYVEAIIIALLLLPFISARAWHKFFQSQFWHFLQRLFNFKWFLYVILPVLILCLLDSYRAIGKYGNRVSCDEHMHTEMRDTVELFRAQRNFNLCIISIFFIPVIQRLVTIISTSATLKTSLREAESASRDAQKPTLITQDDEMRDHVDMGDHVDMEEEHDEAVSHKK